MIFNFWWVHRAIKKSNNPLRALTYFAIGILVGLIIAMFRYRWFQ